MLALINLIPTCAPCTVSRNVVPRHPLPPRQGWTLGLAQHGEVPVCSRVIKDRSSMDLASEAETISQAVPRLAERVEVVPNQAGTFNLRGPRLRRHPINRWFAWLLRLPQQVEVELDDVGTFVVKNLGDSSMEQLAVRLSSEYKLTKREAQAALTVFIKSLLQRRLVTMDGWLGTGNNQ